ncbi:hypothetical protein F5Y17DRAFT_415201 [Xylariaceae sp. FL0594]|nr:hypothetical protein F5Y17DRAFT_415201 [Xylariaceae sp. FL0594]
MEDIAPQQFEKMQRSKRRFVSKGIMPIISEDSVPLDIPTPRPSPTRLAIPDGGTIPRIKRPHPTYYPPPSYNTSIGFSSNASPNLLRPKGSLSSIWKGSVEEKESRHLAWLTKGKRVRCTRLVVFGLIGALAVAALVVGLIVGLGRRRQASSALAPSAQQILFPAGSYSFVTALQNTSTACTSNSAMFRCSPSTTYDASSPAAGRDAMASFLWKIADLGEGQYGISAAPNPYLLGPRFSNVSLALVDSNQASERLVFEVGKLAVAVLPIEPVTSGNGSNATICYYNDTVLTATIWTRRRAEYPANLTTSVDNLGNGTHTSVDYDVWPYAVEVSQVVRADADADAYVPDCRDADGNPVGNFEAPQPGGECGCWYRNFDLDS